MTRLLSITPWLAATLCGCTVALPHAGAGSSSRGTPTAAFPVSYSGETLSQPADEKLADKGAEPASAASAGSAGRHGAPQRTAFALVIGIERYRDVPAAPGARADADAFAALARDTLGLPQSNVRVSLDDRATKSDIERQVAWLAGAIPANGRIYFFYSGHGTPDVKTGSAYIVPYDASATDVAASAVPLDDILALLGKSNARETIAFVDACFSGAGGRSVLPAGAKPLLRVREISTQPRVALFASASGEQIAGPGSDGKGLFTEVLMEGLRTGQADADGDGQVTLAELVEWTRPRVQREAKKLGRDQEPVLHAGKGLGNPSDVAVVWGLK